MEVIFLIGSVQALFFAFLVFNKKSKNISDKILGVWLLVFAIHLVFPFLLYSENYKKYISISGADAGLMVLHVCLLYIYTKSLISEQKRLKATDFLHLIPIVGTYIMLIPFYQLSIEDKIKVYEMEIDFPSSMYISMFIMFTVIAAYVYATLVLIQKHKKDIKHKFSYEENINLRWLQNLIITFIVITISAIALIILLYINQIDVVDTDFLIYILLVGTVYGIGYWGYKQGEIFTYRKPSFETNGSFQHQPFSAVNTENNTNEISQQNGEYKTNSRKSADDLFVKKLIDFMDNEKPYLDNKLSLYDLASSLDVSIYYLSQILNNEIHANFYEFVNNYRINEVKKMFSKNENSRFTILTIAFECGFNSKASFNRIFKNVTGQTPSEYQKSLV
jgi:AraC-like DNA-binding protein